MLRVIAFFIVFSTPLTLAAQVDPFDEARGEVVLDRVAYGIGFETAEPGGATLLRYDTGRRPSNDDPITIETDLAMQGGAVTVLGGDVQRVVARLDETVHTQFENRRVEFRVWYRPLGTKIDAKVVWMSGDPDGQLIRGEPTFFIHDLGTIALQPTGRRTDDGWFELASGPVDFRAGSKVPPAYISFEDVNAYHAGIEPAVSRDPDARVWVDGFTIDDLGDQAVPDQRCTATTEDTCGEFGLCFLGHCTDAATYFGAVPLDDEIRTRHLDRRRFETEKMNGVRVATMVNFATFLDHMDRADSTNPKSFWGEQILAYNALVDGHGRPPRARTVNNVTAGGCAYHGSANLLPGSPTGPIVWEIFDEVPYGQLMQPGDVITSIDGLPPNEFAAFVWREDDYTGDPAAKDIINTPQLLNWAAQTGSSWTVQRCEQATACTAQEVQTITIDPYPDLAPIWDGSPPSFRFEFPQCDFRIDRLNDDPGERAYGFAGNNQEGAVDVVMFNGFPRANTGGGQSGWFVTLNAVLQTNPQFLLLDQRWGTGGYPDALQALHDLLLASTDPQMFGETIPGDVDLSIDARSQLRAFCATRYCGMYALFGYSPAVDGPAANTRIALLNGYDVSANDFFSRRMAERPGRTRIFGHGPTFGAYGFACKFPPHLPGEQNPAYQCTDSVFSTVLNPPDGLFESGTGVSPDEVVLQTQSDTRLGIDTMKQRALIWVETGI